MTLIQLRGRRWIARCAGLVRQDTAAVSPNSAAWRLLGSPVVYTGALYAASGIGFAAANLVLARLLSTSEFALLTLLMSLLNVSIPLAPLGIDGVVNRHALELGPQLLGRALATSLIVGLGTAIVARAVYELDAWAIAILFPSIVAGATTYLVGAYFRSRHRFLLSITLSQVSTYLFLVAAAAVVFVPIKTPYFIFGVISVGLIAAAGRVWLRCFSKEPASADRHFPWGEAFFYVGVHAAGLLLWTMERLTVPKLLTFEDLATFGVLSAVALAPYRIVQSAVGFTLLPRLRAAQNGRERRMLVAREGALCAMAVILAGMVVWWIAPSIAAWFVGDKYQITPTLLAAAIVSGSVRIASSIPRSAASALCTTEELGWFAGLNWAAVGLAFLGAWLGSGWGLPGILYGVAFGGLVHGLAAASIAARHIRSD